MKGSGPDDYYIDVTNEKGYNTCHFKSVVAYFARNKILVAQHRNLKERFISSV